MRLLAEVARGVVGEARRLRVVDLLGVGVPPVVAPAGVDIEHVAGQDAAAAEALRLEHALDVLGGDDLAGLHRLAACRHRLFASSSTALVMIGGDFSMPSLSSGESGVGFTSSA